MNQKQESQYATTQTFDGQRAAVCMIVVVKTSFGIEAGLIVAIDDDKPVIRAIGPQGDTLPIGLKYCGATTEQELRDATGCTWCWPPKV